MNSKLIKSTTLLKVDNPYVGPESFARGDPRPFEGREREASDLAALLIARRLVLFYAESGAGKTSLINAGLIPYLENKRQFEVLPVARVGRAAVANSVTQNPYLFSLMVNIDERHVGQERFVKLRLTDFLLDTVQIDGHYFYQEPEADFDSEIIGDVVEDENPTEVQPRALIIDQFEEIFTSHVSKNASRERTVFFKQLAEAMADDPYLHVMLSMRADYVHHLNRYVYLLPDGLRTRFYMSRMRPEQALNAVKTPAARAGRPFAEGVAEELVAHLQRERTQDSETTEEQYVPGETVEPMQLQVVCYQLWQSLADTQGQTISRDDLTQVAHNVLKKEQELDDPLAVFVDSALGSYYEQSLLQALEVTVTDISEEYLRDWFSKKLITEAGTRGFLQRGEEETLGVPEPVVAALEKQHLIRSESRAGSKWVELIHDSFIEPVRAANEKWTQQQMREKPWMAAAYRWEQQGRPDNLLSRDDLLAVALVEAGDLGKQIPVVREFLIESQREQTKRENELEHQQKLAAEQEARRKDAESAAERQKKLTRIAVIVGIISIITTIVAIIQLYEVNEAKQNADIARENTDLALQTAEAASESVIAAAANVATAQSNADTSAEELENALATQGALFEQIQSHTPLVSSSNATLTPTPSNTSNYIISNEIRGTQTAISVENQNYEFQINQLQTTLTALANEGQVNEIHIEQLEGTHAAIVATFVSPRAIIFGTSGEYTLLEAVRFGNGPHRIVLVGGLHAGKNPSTVDLAEQTISYYEQHPGEIPPEISLYVIDNINPDSERNPGSDEGRYNANGVDLNRNWNCNWSADPLIGDGVVVGAGGNEPLSEPETRTLAGFLQEIEPSAVIIWFARAVGGLVIPGGCPTTAVSEELTELYADGADYRFNVVTSGEVTQGDVSNWLDFLGIPAISVLLPSYTDPDFENNLAAVQSLMNFYSQQ